MRPIMVLAPFALAMATVAGAACDDTLVLQSLTVYRQSLRNTATLGAWDSVVVQPIDSLGLLQASPVPSVAFLGTDATPAPETFHYTKFGSNCGLDSVSEVEAWRVVDTLGPLSQGGGQGPVASLSKQTLEIPVRKIKDQMIYSAGAMHSLAYEWSTDLFDVGMANAKGPIESWSAVVYGVSYHRTAGVPRLPVAQPIAYDQSIPKPISLMLNGFVANSLAGMRPSIDSIGGGVVDSTRIEIVKYRYVYSDSRWVGISPRLLPRRDFQVWRTPLGWTLQLPKPASVQVVGLDGRMVRQFAAARSIAWDGRDAFGAKVHPGVWLLRAEGIGTLSVLVR